MASAFLPHATRRKINKRHSEASWEVKSCDTSQAFRHRGSRRCISRRDRSVRVRGRVLDDGQRDRLINAQNEPQNWLMMNGDCGSMRYSNFRSIARTSEPADGVGAGARRHAGYRPERSENEVNPLIDGFVYTTDGWGTVYKIDAHQSQQGGSSGSAFRRRHRATFAYARHRAVGRSGDRQPARRRVIAINALGEIVWDKQVAKPDEFGSRKNSSPPRSPQARSSSPTGRATRRPAAGSPRSTSRPATNSGAGTWCKAAIRSETWRQDQCLEDRRRQAATGSYDPTSKLTV